MSKFDFYSQIPSTLSLESKISLISKVYDLGIQGISISTLPSNHDIFQFISHVSRQFSLNFGISIISPLFFQYSNLEKSILTLNEILGNKNRLFIAFGLGDRFTLEKYYPNETNFIQLFEKTILQLKEELNETNTNLDILIAGSGQKMMNFALENNFGILFNGINIPPSLDNSKDLGIFIMSHFGNLETIPDNHLKVLIKMLVGLPKSEKTRLKIEDQDLNTLKDHLKNKKSSYEIKKTINIDLLNKIGFIGHPDELTKKIENSIQNKAKKIVLSQSPFDQWSKFNIGKF
ncbi:MAG: hypothetical protein ACW967_01100 [Candidatus Hodarchaeales archaeon]|jgi:hypothetical protein